MDGDPMQENSAEMKYKVLYIEDNPSNLELMKEIIKLHGNIELMSAHNAELGIDLASSILPDLILLDINLPGMDGFEAMLKIRKTPMIQDIPVIAVTAKAMKDDIAQGKMSGFSEYVTKPLDIGLFLDILGRYLP